MAFHEVEVVEVLPHTQFFLHYCPRCLSLLVKISIFLKNYYRITSISIPFEYALLYPEYCTALAVPFFASFLHVGTL